MATKQQMDQAQPGDILMVIHDFVARTVDELSLARGDRIELIERDDEFGDAWFLGKHLQNGNTGLFPEVYTTPAPKPTLNSASHQRNNTQTSIKSAAHSFTQKAEDEIPPPYVQGSQSSIVPEGNNVYSSPPIVEEISPSPPIATTLPLQASFPQPEAQPSAAAGAASRSLSMAMTAAQTSPVMNETLSVIDEHITDMNTPRHSLITLERRGNDSGSEYSSHLDHRLSYINGHETDEEEQTVHTEEEVSQWSPDMVAGYLEDNGVEKRHCEVFIEQEISGEVLLGMDQSSIFLKEFDLGPVGRRLRTWHKIKALQQEVKASKTSKPTSRVGSVIHTNEDSTAGADSNRNRSTSMTTVLPRIPSLRESPKSPPSRQNTVRQSSQDSGMASRVNMTPSPSLDGPGPTRPSAASVRNMNHNRRHSSIDFAANGPSKSTESFKISAPPQPIGHRKQASIDRSWTMSGRQSAAGNGRATPSMHSHSHSHSHSISTAGPKYEPMSELGLTVVSSAELDRGYFSGNEVDNRKSGRNVLRKNTAGHSRNSSFNTEGKRRSGYSHSRMGSTDSTARDNASLLGGAKSIYYSPSQKKSNRVASETQLRPLSSGRDMSPTVTKLDYGHSPSIDAVAFSPALGSEASSTGQPSPVAHSSFFKGRALGLRAISDAITGGEKAAASSPTTSIPSPIKESPLQSPIRTGSSTPSGTSKSFDFDPAASSVARSTTASSGGHTPISATTTTSTRRGAKSKKATSAYTRGLQKKTPKEQMEGCDFSGWMKKRSSNLMTTWKSRLFVLRGRRLSYYYSENDTEEKGLIDISGHRVLPANEERLTGLHASLTGAASPPISPQPGTGQVFSSIAGAVVAPSPTTKPTTSMFIFKLVPPRNGLSKGVNFTKPTVHYFAVESLELGRLWMAAMMKATIDRDIGVKVVSTYNQKTISLAKARAMRQRPPALRDD
ncbi:hypothetical protein M501DRAFT_914248, partial [Patellaria atrata CBS 101060]